MTVTSGKQERCDLCNRRVPIPWRYVTPNKARSLHEAEHMNVPWFADPDWNVCADCDAIITNSESEEGMMRLFHFSASSQAQQSMTISIGISPEDLQEIEVAVARDLLHIIMTFWNNWTERHPEPQGSP